MAIDLVIGYSGGTHLGSGYLGHKNGQVQQLTQTEQQMLQVE